MNSPLTIYVVDWPVQMTEKASNVELFENVMSVSPEVYVRITSTAPCTDQSALTYIEFDGMVGKPFSVDL